MKKPSNSWFVYVVRCSDNSLYTGITTEVERRVNEHNHSKSGARYTKTRRPVILEHVEQFSNRAQASRREWEIKQLSAKEKKGLIEFSTKSEK